MHRRMQLALAHRAADLGDEGAALAAMGQELAGLIGITRGLELDDLYLKRGYRGRQAAGDLFGLH
jgi:hypothetical protein